MQRGLGGVRLALLLLFSLFFIQPALADWSGPVVWVQDGDSLIVKRGGERVVIRLQGIDTPEKGQPFAQEAKKTAIRLAKNKRVRIQVKERDKYGRMVAQVFLPDGRNLAHTLVRMGLAWRHIYFAKDPMLKTLEEQARKAGLGLWQERNPTPPWVWKKRLRKKNH